MQFILKFETSPISVTRPPSEVAAQWLESTIETLERVIPLVGHLGMVVELVASRVDVASHCRKPITQWIDHNYTQIR